MISFVRFYQRGMGCDSLAWASILLSSNKFQMIHSYVSSQILNFIDSMRVNDKVVSTKTSWNMWNNVNCQNENKRSFYIAESRDIGQDVNIQCSMTWFKIRIDSKIEHVIRVSLQVLNCLSFEGNFEPSFLLFRLLQTEQVIQSFLFYRLRQLQLMASKCFKTEMMKNLGITLNWKSYMRIQKWYVWNQADERLSKVICFWLEMRTQRSKSWFQN